jgi:peptidoglycan/xylan/chitin deacetylase (PgdA/CDA1 family)
MVITGESGNNLEWPALQRSIEKTQPLAEKKPSIIQRGLKKIFPKFIKPTQKYVYKNGVYILIYHSVVDHNNRQLWEQCYRKGEVLSDQFRSQLNFLMDHMTPIALSKIPALWAQGGPERPYFSITFDDGFRNNLTVANPIIQEYGIKPTVFVNRDFATGKEVFYRILSAIILEKGYATPLATKLRLLAGQHDWSDNRVILFNQMKQNYVADIIEKATGEIFCQYLGNPEELAVHLQVDDIKALQASGWEIANHTEAHRLLSSQSSEAAISAIERNAAFWHDNGVKLIDYLAFPVGRVQDVNQIISQWLDRSPEINGMFANNGVNLKFNRKEWLRFSFGNRTKPEELDKMIKNQLYRTDQAYKTLEEIN